MHFGRARAVAFLAFGSPVEQKPVRRGTDMKLEAMDSIMHPANTQEHMERLRLLPSRKSVARTKGGRR
jgi:hypothetical protein